MEPYFFSTNRTCLFATHDGGFLCFLFACGRASLPDTWELHWIIKYRMQKYTGKKNKKQKKWLKDLMKPQRFNCLFFVILMSDSFFWMYRYIPWSMVFNACAANCSRQDLLSFAGCLSHLLWRNIKRLSFPVKNCKRLQNNKRNESKRMAIPSGSLFDEEGTAYSE